MKERIIACLRRIHVCYWRILHLYIGVRINIYSIRRRYTKVLDRIKRNRGRKPIKVLFLVSNSAKWKAQSVFNLMSKTDRYLPFIALTLQDQELTFDEKRRQEQLQELKDFFSTKGMATLQAYSSENFMPITLRDFAPDVIFYQTPWNVSSVQSPEKVSKYALTSYVPYFVQNYGNLTMDCCEPFHRYLWRHYTLNDYWAREFMNVQDATAGRAGKVVGTGHPMLDMLSDISKTVHNNDTVIYAPHWSCGIGECYSTFHKVGLKMLEFAQHHTEIKWIFKPHPTLRKVLTDEKIMTEDEAQSYYTAWERLGNVCYGGGYESYFEDSAAMITDCGSFLVEYACTGRPIIHLISSDAKFAPHPISKVLFDTYYKAKGWDEFCKIFQDVVINGNDYLRERRLQKVKEMNLSGSNAARKIVNDLDREIGIESYK